MWTDQQVFQRMIFPASYSTLCPSALAEFVAESYRLNNVDCSLLVRGVGDTYLINSHQGRFILRLYRSSHRSSSNVQAEVGLLFTLKHAAVPVSYPIIDRHGEAIQTINAIEGQDVPYFSVTRLVRQKEH